ncbi:helix-turn-helix domain-containing protein [Bacteroides thetaiotaomicron]|jgi:excisionase family DNA binding protein|uniref:helix-turn-helix domain-containing protein n=1 Tax=Bacteroides thetaiotaomicron TaxID=818 RepID=UPI00189AD9C4|nr:helix-turn-helix domain-containing protein [Bacteroides thetaiotaomicron]MBV3102061.1 helix-turn-helix domain-containing protein [Bacteroides thetaiotaomicron]MBV3106901.1 helix-turn-helix domain-containing protein [Bacteroides thetaiotaomicron]MBV3133800.1 helix-turn-helix domain-containing protein [Bacteroides thetaiotaomicron]
MEDVITERTPQVIAFFQTMESLLTNIESMAGNCRPFLNGERFMTDKQLAEVLKISRRTLQDYRTNGILSYYMVGGKVLYKESDVLKLLEDNYYPSYK